MRNKKKFELIIGGEYTAQQKHKRKIIPEDFLVHFCNVDTNNLKDVVNFANRYSFTEYIVPDENNSIIDKFKKIQEKYKPILHRFIEYMTINYSDIKTINEDLSFTSPRIVLRDTINDLKKIEEGFSIYVLKNTNNEEPHYDIVNFGLLDKLHRTKDNHIIITMRVPHESKTKWYVDRVKDGLLELTTIFPSENWEANKEYLKYLTLKSGKITFNSDKQPISLEMNLYIGKTNFTKDELAAAWSPTTGESSIAKRFWDYLNTEYRGKEFKLCKICAKLHTGKSYNYCNQTKCRKEWDSHRQKYKKN